MVHAIRLAGGRALSYRNRWLRTDAISGALNELPTPGPRNGPDDNVNANLVRHAGRTLAVAAATALPLVLDSGLATRARTDFDGTLPAASARTPSPTRSPANSSRSRPTTRGTRRFCSPSTSRAGSAKHCRSRSRAAPGCTPSPSPNATPSSSTCR